MYVSFPPGRGSTLPPPSSPADLTPAAARDPAKGGGDGAAAAASLAANRAGELEIIAMDIEEMSRAVFHLTRSNNELREALVETPGDPDFEAAIIENVDVIAAKLAKIAELKKIYNAMQAAMGGATAAANPSASAEAKASEGDVPDASTPAAPDEAAPAASGVDAAGGLLL